jgi:hypothetical protein
MEGSRARRGLSCLAAALMLTVTAAAAAPVWEAAATPVAAQDASPVRVRVSPAVNALGGRPMAPGEVLYRPVTVHNDGPNAFTYRMSVVLAAGSGLLADHLVVEGRATDRCGPGGFTQAPVVSGPASMAALGASAPRPVPAGGAERLCLRIALPDGVPAALNGATLDAVLRVAARET